MSKLGPRADFLAHLRALARAARMIKIEAEGRTCDGCASSRGTWCAKLCNWTGHPLVLMRADATACSQWRSRGRA